KLYGVETRVLKQAVRRNENKFPDGYLFKLTQNEFNSWKINKTSQNVTSFGGVQYAPFAFTEKGLYMLATVLKSPDAVEAAFAIIKTFSKLRELAGIMKRLNEENVPVAELKTLKARSNKLFKDVFTDPLPLKMRKTKFSFNFGIMNISIETVREQSG
ncbi:MAG: ORF6N domain-containing protein, partial [Tannerella sp.]|nr:ORF6N domain-containing protein [Tannerella sp.]